MNNIIKTAAIELNSIDNNDIIKMAGILDKLKNIWKGFWDRGYQSNLNRVRADYARIEADVRALKDTIESINQSIQDANVAQYDTSVRRLKNIVNRLAAGAESVQNAASTIAPPQSAVDQYEHVNEYTLEQYNDPEFRRRLEVTPDPRIRITQSIAKQVKLKDVEAFSHITKENISWNTGVVLGVSKKIIKEIKDKHHAFNYRSLRSAFNSDGVITSNTIDAINEAIVSNGYICHYYPPVPAAIGSTTERQLQRQPIGQMLMGIETEFNLPNSLYKLQVYFNTRSSVHSRRQIDKISIWKVNYVRILSPHFASIPSPASNPINDNDHDDSDHIDSGDYDEPQDYPDYGDVDYADDGFNIKNKFAATKNPEGTILAVRGIEKTSPAFKEKLIQISKDLNTNPDWIAAIISRETVGTFSPTIENPYNGAVGLIQFTGDTAASIFGHYLKKPVSQMSDSEKQEWRQIAADSKNKIKSSSAIQQLNYVKKFFELHSGKLNSPEDVYTATVWPAAVGKSDDFVISSKGQDTYRKNQNLDPNDTGKITKKQIGGAINSIISEAEGKRISIDGKIIDSKGKELTKQNPANQQKDKEQSDKKPTQRPTSPSANKNPPKEDKRRGELDTESDQQMAQNPNQQTNEPQSDELQDKVSCGPLEKIIRTAIEKKVLPQNIFSISLDESNRDQAIKLANNLKRLVNAEVSIQQNKDNFKIKCIAYGPKDLVSNAIDSICNLSLNG